MREKNQAAVVVHFFKIYYNRAHEEIGNTIREAML